jgi:HTH-type transcriptional regulator/antitoxin HigA
MTVKQRRRKSTKGAAKIQVWKSPKASYLALVREFPIRPIESNDDLDDAIRMLDKLLERTKPLDIQEQGYFDSLTNEIHRYESSSISMPRVTGEDMLKHLIDAREVTLSEVAANTGIAISTLSAILAKNRNLNLAHIKALAPYFGVEEAVFI